MKKIPHETIEKIKKIPMNRVLSQPKYKGRAYEKFICPLHNDHNPSFVWYKDSNTWRCFGCDKGGDIIDFIRELSNVSFIKAIEYLKNRYL